ncbi:hypothetical protein [Paeniglutamicibacter terrestris]|uniref:GLUG domain-containing protein n=1 Tax=Paeniglutamicibacter terrestris TaxID=2723403 RepID=A0ABX1G9U5_9MICC|nr:hypothetical protein [Paeniglutamicibacter terrestris]NKG22395.1 hypothetical protein [Paeniglutamicibacter terrestris]
MGRNIEIDGRLGGGAAHEILFGEVTIESTALRQEGTKTVFPGPKTYGISNGLATLVDVDVSPAGPEPEWAYRVTFRDHQSGKGWSELIGVPAGTSALPYSSDLVPRFTTAIPAETTAAMVQNWVDTTEAAKATAVAAAAEATAPTDAMVAGKFTDPTSDTALALDANFVGTDDIEITQVSVGFNFKAGSPDNAIAPDVHGSVIAGDGYPGRENVIGRGVIENVNTSASNVPLNLADLLQPDANARANHSYVADYDNVAAGLKSVILADHSYIRAGATHNGILSGAVHKIDVGDFSIILGGYGNWIKNGDYCVSVGGLNNIIDVAVGGFATTGGNGNEVTGSGGTAFGASNKVAGPGGFAAGTLNQVNSGSAFGQSNIASGAGAMAFGNYNEATNTYSYASGNQSKATGQGAYAMGGLCEAIGSNSHAMGLQAVARKSGQSSRANGAFSVPGDAQTSEIIDKLQTTAGAAACFPNSFALEPGHTIQYRFMITARDTATGDSKAWTLGGVAKRVGTGAAVAVGGSVPAAVLVAGDAAASTWNAHAAVAVNSLLLYGTGEVGKTIRWIARAEYVEVS